MISRLLADDLFWNFQFGKLSDVSQIWAGILKDYFMVNDTLREPRINYVLNHAKEGGLMGLIEKERF